MFFCGERPPSGIPAGQMPVRNADLFIYTLQTERGIHMEIAIMITGICAIIVLTAAFFGILKKSGKDGGAELLSDISGVERQYGKLNAECGLIYIYVSYKTDTHDIFKHHYFTDKEVSEFCTAFGCRGAKVDGSNYIVAARLDKESAESFCRSFSHCEDKYSGIEDTSIGVYIMPDNSGDFKRAAGYAKKIARYAKNNGEKYVIVTPEELDKIIEDDNIEKNIASYIDNDNFYQLYQPLFDAKSGKIIGCEALTRLKLDGVGEIPPARFLNAVKRENLSEKFDMYVFEKCCRWAAARAGKNIVITCNFSRATLSGENAAEEITAIAEKTGVMRGMLAIEIVEDYFKGDFETVRANAGTLKKEGFKVCLDDFGKGFTSLGDLAKLSPNVIKIDKSIVDNIETEQGRVVFDNIVRLAKEMNATVLCEGIETASQSEAARAAGCDIMQGYYFFRPMPENEFDLLLK